MDKLMAVALAALLAVHGRAHSQVVADGACPHYAVDIAAFATCDGDRVAHKDVDFEQMLLPEASVPTEKRTAVGLYVDARGAYRLQRRATETVVFVDVRSPHEVALAGRASSIDVQVPYREHTPAESVSFLGELLQELQRRQAGPDTLILLMCQSGERSARAADELASVGYERVANVIDGFEGDLDSDGRRSVNGWKNAGLPWFDSANLLTRSPVALELP